MDIEEHFCCERCRVRLASVSSLNTSQITYPTPVGCTTPPGMIRRDFRRTGFGNRIAAIPTSPSLGVTIAGIPSMAPIPRPVAIGPSPDTSGYSLGVPWYTSTGPDMFVGVGVDDELLTLHI